MPIIDEIKQDILRSFNSLNLEVDEKEISINPDEIEAEISVKLFKLARKYNKDLRDLGNFLETSLKNIKYVKEIEFINGYLNFYIDWQNLFDYLNLDVKKIKESGINIGKNKKIIVDFSSPNIAKPMSVAHLRSTIIGDSLARIMEKLGYKVIRDNHLGDWGTQFGKLILAYKMWGNEEEVEKNKVYALFQLYVKFHKECEKNKELEDLARKEFKKLEEGDKENLKLWKWFVEISKKEFMKIYDLLNVRFDLWLGESFYVEEAKKLVEFALEKGIAVKDEGAVIIPLEDHGLPNLVIQKSDESTLYATRDLACIKYRVEKFKPEKIVYVVGSEQKLYFKQVFKAAELLGIKKCDLIHVDFGLLRLPEGKLSTRKGRVVFLEDVINKSIEEARKIIIERGKIKDKEKMEECARKIGISAIKFADLSKNRRTDIVFDFKKMLDFEGDTAPYLQYTYVRASSILKKAREKREKVTENYNYEPNKVEKMILRNLMVFPEILLKANEYYEPHRIAEHLLKIARYFNSFYQKYPIIGEKDANARSFRLKLTEAVMNSINLGLGLLGIDVLEEM